MASCISASYTKNWKGGVTKKSYAIYQLPRPGQAVEDRARTWSTLWFVFHSDYTIARTLFVPLRFPLQVLAPILTGPP